MTTDFNDPIGDKWTAIKEVNALAPAMTVAGYESLARILNTAYHQSASGKGKERHANARPFDNQPISTIPALLGSAAIGGPAYQVIKKTQEAVGMFERGAPEAAIAEMLGAIVYAAATIRVIEKSLETE